MGMHKFFVLSLILLTGQNAFSAAVLKPTGSYMQSIDDSGTTKTTKTRTIIEIPFGYYFDMGVGALGIYSTEKGLDKTESTSGGGTSAVETSRTSYGAGIGWMDSSDIGIFVNGYYFFNTEMTQSTTTYKGTGYQADLGIKFPVKRAFLAVQFSYKYYEYNKTTAGGVETDLATPRKLQFFDPQAAIIVMF